MKHWILLAIAVHACLCAAAIGQTTLPSVVKSADHATRSTLIESKSNEPRPASVVDDITVTAVIEMVQPQADGINLVLEFSNQRAEAVKILNPFDFLAFMVNDSTGFPMRMPIVVPRYLNCSADPKEVKLAMPFQLRSVTIDQTAMSPAEVEDKVWTLPPHSTTRAAIRIDRFLKNPAPDNTTTVPPPSDSYEVRVLCIVSTPGKERMTLESGKLGTRLEGK